MQIVQTQKFWSSNVYGGNMNLFKIWALLLFIFYLLKMNKIDSKVRVHSDLFLLPTLPKLTNKTLSIVLQMEVSKNLIF